MRGSLLPLALLTSIIPSLVGCRESGVPPATGEHDRRVAFQATVPDLKLGAPQAAAGVPAATVRAFLRAQQVDLLECWMKPLAARAGEVPAGSAGTLELTVDGTGKVAAARASGFDPRIGACVEQVVAGATLAAWPEGTSGAVSYPLELYMRPLG